MEIPGLQNKNVFLYTKIWKVTASSFPSDAISSRKTESLLNFSGENTQEINLNVFKYHPERVWWTFLCFKMCMFYNIREKPEKKSLAKVKLIFSSEFFILWRPSTHVPRLSAASFVVEFSSIITLNFILVKA